MSICETSRREGPPLLPCAFAALGLIALLAPALWNGYPLLQYDTGGYLARWYEGYLVPSRSTVFGLYLHLGEGIHFWPVLIVQSLLTLWILALVLRAHGVARTWRSYVVTLAVLCIATTLPFLTSILLTDIFAGLGVLALHLLLFRSDRLRRAEPLALMALVAFASATHSATMATLIALLALGALGAFLAPGITSGRALLNGGYAIAVGAAMLLAANFALSGKLQWTPGGYGIVFGRLMQDGIVTRYLDDHCAHEKLKLCPYRHEFPATADEFLWNDGPFNKLGRFDGLGEEMRHIVLGSLAEYPGQQLLTAVKATLEQLGLVATGYGVHNQIWHTYGIIERYIPSEVAAMHAAHQQHGLIHFHAINRLHVPIAILSMLLLVLPLSRLRQWKEDDGVALLAASVTIALLSNAFVCGALSGPHARYGARMSWVLTFVAVIVALRFLARTRVSPAASPAAVASVP